MRNVSVIPKWVQIFTEVKPNILATETCDEANLFQIYSRWESSDKIVVNFK